MKTFSILAALLFSAQWLLAQDTQSPLYLYISGSGKIEPFEDGQMLDDGGNYVMKAVPDKGWVFAHWEPVDVYTFVISVRNQNNQITTVTSTDVSPDYTGGFKDRNLHFTMQPEEVVTEIPDLLEITWSQGWQADFVPVPRKQHGNK